MTKKSAEQKKKTVLKNNLIPKKVPPKNIIISLALVKTLQSICAEQI